MVDDYSIRLYEGGWTGKLPQEILEQIVLSRVRGLTWASTLMGPAIGEDAALIDLGSCVMAVHSDPITESHFSVGSLAVDVASNDIAVRGVRPQWMLVDVLMPVGSLLSSLSAVVSELSSEARRLGIEIVGGHTEASPGLKHAIVIATVMGCGRHDYIVTTAGAKEGDIVIQVNPTAMEATAIIANDFKDLLLGAGLSESEISEASSLISRASIMNYALPLAERRLVTSMHDITEGGLIGATYEVAKASGHDITIYSDSVVVEDITRKIFTALKMDPLKSMGSGSFIATVRPENKERVLELLRDLGVKSSVIGVVGGSSRTPKLIVKGKGSEQVYSSPPEDEVAKLWSRGREPND
ncbi:Putative hydrogenase expression/formation protein HypE [Acidilobus saccharovorans 345-15]|uniref:Putative hydrogenase expression/formation protein HypE n=1 Tax=Acidilobus saccharovorans (strain DSM 16705 / JCM 18335 / VKM B-2471 / 345-15) TaxID=666510 RepID=D9Q093_ACIS3|nr:AIR synthase-related protein [Acidilobus saccharovorans]ADL18731.1 Putative hydrogenase expression/formation protein HypE [Acidilobus saccharovorans 345-15]